MDSKCGRSTKKRSHQKGLWLTKRRFRRDMKCVFRIRAIFSYRNRNRNRDRNCNCDCDRFCFLNPWSPPPPPPPLSPPLSLYAQYLSFPPFIPKKWIIKPIQRNLWNIALFKLIFPLLPGWHYPPNKGRMTKWKNASRLLCDKSGICLGPNLMLSREKSATYVCLGPKIH